MGYRESVSIFHEIMVMTAFGTAIKLKIKVNTIESSGLKNDGTTTL